MALGRATNTRKRVPDVPCGYCFSAWAQVWDHLIPVSHGGRNQDSNLYPACSRCNALLSDKVFDSIELKREYVRLVLKSRGEWEKDAPSTPRPFAKKREPWFTPAEVIDILDSKKAGHSAYAIATSYLCGTALICKVLKTQQSPYRRG